MINKIKKSLKYLLLIIVISLISLSIKNLLSNCKNDFSTLKNLQQYAKTLKEYPNIDNTNWIIPDYTTYIKKITPSLFTRILYYLYLEKKSLWTAKLLKNSLERVTKYRTQKNQKDNFIKKILPKTETNFVLFGDIHGAFHSLIRDLTQLKKLKIIDNNLKIIKPNYYIIFLGDLVSRSAYSCETLTLILSLLEKNPNKIICLKGQHEQKENWHNFDFKEELKIKAKYISKETIPLNKEINNFFNTLPLGFFISLNPKKTNEFLRISHENEPHDLLNEAYISNFLKEKISAGKIEIFNLKNKKEINDPVTVKAMIRGEHYTSFYELNKGLKFLPPVNNISTWTALSCPTSTYRINFEFFYDAFSIISNGKSGTEWTITLFYQNLKTKNGFKEKQFNLLTGETIKKRSINSKKPKREKIRIGSTMDLTEKIEPYVGKDIFNGIFTRITKANNNNEIPGKKIKLKIFDDKFEPLIAKKNIERLYYIFDTKILLTTLSSYTLQKYLQFIEEKNILSLFPEATSSIFRKPKIKNLIHFFASSKTEAHILIKYAIKELKQNKFFIIYEEDPFTISAFKEAKKVFQQNKLKYKTNWDAVSFTQIQELDVVQLAKRIKKFNPSTIIFLGFPSMSNELILRDLGVEFFVNKIIMGISTFVTSNLFTLAQQRGIRVITTNLIPNPEKSDLEIVKEFREDMAEKGLPLHPFSLEGYISASLFVEIAKKIHGTVTREKLLEEIKKLKNYNFKGIKLNFNPATNEIANNVWINKGYGEWILKTYSNDS